MLKSDLEGHYPMSEIFYFIAKFFKLSKGCKFRSEDTRPSLAGTILSFQLHLVRFFASGFCSPFLILSSLAVCSTASVQHTCPLSLGIPSFHPPSSHLSSSCLTGLTSASCSPGMPLTLACQNICLTAATDSLLIHLLHLPL